jgi:hypothetical protein
VSEAIVFASICPICKGEQVQQRFNVASLHRLLKAGHPIEAYCEICDEYWLIEVQQRMELGEVVRFWRDVGAQSEHSPPAMPPQD